MTIYIEQGLIYVEIPKMPEEFWDDQGWRFAHQTELSERYRDEWVAIVDEKVVASGKDPDKVEKEAKRKTGKKYFPVMFVESGSHIY